MITAQRRRTTREILNPSELLDRVPPFDYGAEKAVVGSLLVDDRHAKEVMAILTPDDFHGLATRTVYECMAELFQKKKPIDVLTVHECLQRSGRLPDSGGYAFFATLVNDTPIAAHARYYAEIVAAKSRTRDVIHLGLDLVRLGYLEMDTPEQLILKAATEIAKLRKRVTR
jgi:replicative DNA helicase